MTVDDVLLAHPVTDAAHLPLAPPLVVIVAATLVVAVATSGRVRPGPVRPLQRTSGQLLSPADRVLRTVAVTVLGVALLAAQLGTTTPMGNLAPVLLVAAGVPLMVLAALILGPVWPRIDPIDALARALRAPDGPVDAPAPATVAAGSGSPPAPATTADGTDRDGAAADDPAAAVPHVWPAVAVALAGVAFLTVHPTSLQPRTLAVYVAGYLLLTVSGCLAFGRRRWLEQVEAFGLLLTWFGGLRGRRLVGWVPPAGAGALLGVVGGGLLFGVVRGTARYGELVFAVGLRTADIGGVVTFALLGALLVEVGARRWRTGSVTAAAAPMVAAIVLVYSLRDARAIIALDLLPGLLVDPLGRGWTIGGFGQMGPRTLPFELRDLLVGQLAVLVVGALAAARVTRLRCAATGTPVGPAVLVTVGLLAAAVAALATTTT